MWDYKVRQRIKLCTFNAKGIAYLSLPLPGHYITHYSKTELMKDSISIWINTLTLKLKLHSSLNDIMHEIGVFLPRHIISPLSHN